MNETAENDRLEIAAELARLLAESGCLRLSANADDLLAARRLKLRAWQAARLASSHADLLASPRFGRGAEFFLSDLYGPKDFSDRDADVKRILPLMTSMLPLSGLRTVRLAVEVDALSERLDAAMVAALGDTLDGEVSPSAYAEAYRLVGRRPERERQLELIHATGEALDALARKSFVRGALKMMRGPAHLAGLGALHDFLERGFESFRSMKDADEFLTTVISRENRILRALYAGRDDPFAV